jgi:hypothetical protein
VPELHALVPPSPIIEFVLFAPVIPLSASENVAFDELHVPDRKSSAAPLGDTSTIATLFSPPPLLPVILTLLRVIEMDWAVPTPLTEMADPTEVPTVPLTVIPLPVHVVTLPVVEQLACPCDGSSIAPIVKASRLKNKRRNRADDTE